MNTDAVFRAVTIGAHQLLAVIDRRSSNLCLGMFWWERSGTLPDFATDSASVVNVEGFASDAIVRKLAVNEEVILVNGWDSIRIWDGSTMRVAGIDPAPAPSIAVGSVGGLTGSYTAVYTYYDSTRGYETNPVATAPTVITLAAQSLAVTVVASTDSRFDKIRVYRNKNGVPATLLLDREVSNVNAVVELSQADSALGTSVSYGSCRPPIARYVAKTSSRIFWAGTRPYLSGTATFTNGSTSVVLTDSPPPQMYTRNVEAPIYIQKVGGPRYGVTAISGGNVTISPAYRERTSAGASFVMTGLPTRVWYCDVSGTSLLRMESWPANNYFDMSLAGDAAGKDFPDEITGLREYGNKIYAFLRESIWQFDPLLSQKRRTGAAKGTLSDRTVVQDRDGNLIYVGTDQQVYAFNGASTVCISDKVRNRFAKKSRYNLNLAEYAFAFYDEREGLYVIHRPTNSATLTAMRYSVDVYDDYRGEWTERVAPRLSAACTARDETHHLILGIDTLGLVHVVNDYEASTSFGDDSFTGSAFTELTSTAGEISPGSNKKGKLAVVYTATTVKGSKLIVGTQSSSATTEDLTDAVTVAAADKYIIGAWHSTYETAWLDFGQPDALKVIYGLSGTFIKDSQGYFFATWYVNESTTKVDTIRINVSDDREFFLDVAARFNSIKFKFEGVSELVGFGLREINMNVRVMGEVE